MICWPQITLWGSAGPRFEPGTGDLEAGTLTTPPYRPSHLLVNFALPHIAEEQVGVRRWHVDLFIRAGGDFCRTGKGRDGSGELWVVWWWVVSDEWGVRSEEWWVVSGELWVMSDEWWVVSCEWWVVSGEQGWEFAVWFFRQIANFLTEKSELIFCSF